MEITKETFQDDMRDTKRHLKDMGDKAKNAVEEGVEVARDKIDHGKEKAESTWENRQHRANNEL